MSYLASFVFNFVLLDHAVILLNDSGVIPGTPSVGMQSIYKWYLNNISVLLLSSNASTTRWAKLTGSSAQNIKRIRGTENRDCLLFIPGGVAFGTLAPLGISRT